MLEFRLVNEGYFNGNESSVLSGNSGFDPSLHVIVFLLL